MKMQVLINVLCLHKNSMAMKLYFRNQDVKEIRAVKIYKDCKCLQKQTTFRGGVDQKVNIKLQKF